MRIVSQSISALFYGLLPTVALAQPVVTPPPFTAQNPTLGTLPSYNDASVNWKNAGLVKIGGIPVRNTQCGATVNPTGLTPPIANDDFVKITAAIAACPAGQVVQLGTGTFQFAISELPLIINKGITLRGTGNCTNGSYPYCQTVINTYDGPWPTYDTTPQCAATTSVSPPSTGSTSNCPFTSPMIMFMPVANIFDFGWAGCQVGASINPTTSNCGTTIAADVSQGATTVQVASTSNFSVGMWVLMDESPQLVSTANPTDHGSANIQASSEWLNTTGSPVVMRLANPDGICVYSFCTDRVNQEIHLVTAIGGGSCPGVNCTLTFDDPITMAYRQSGSHDARVYWPTNSGGTPVSFVAQAGIENLSLTRATSGAIRMEFCAYCWVKGVEARFWINGAINAAYTVRSQITGSYLYDCVDCQPNGAEYPVGIDNASTEVLVDNNIILRGGKGLVVRAANTVVIAYNYIDEMFYELKVIAGDQTQDMGANASHYAGSHHALLEGNWAPNCDDDETHGNNIYHTYFRNYCTALRTAFVDPSSVAYFGGSNNKTIDDANDIAWNGFPTPVHAGPGPLRTIGPMAFNYWHAYVGNVLGTSGITTIARGWRYNGTSGGTIVDHAIWMSGWTGSEWGSFPDHNLDGVTNTWIHRHGNYDYVTPGIADWTTGYSRALPNSYYLTSQPSYFGATANCTYPWPWVTPTAGSVLQTPTGGSCTASSGNPAKARFDAGTPFAQP